MTIISRLLVGLALCVPATTRCQRIVPRDSVLLSRDVDGNGRSDYVVREVKRGKERESLVPTRTAVYLNRAPSTRKPQWASKWNDEVPIELDTVLAVPGGGSLLALGWGSGDGT